MHVQITCITPNWCIFHSNKSGQNLWKLENVYLLLFSCSDIRSGWGYGDTGKVQLRYRIRWDRWAGQGQVLHSQEMYTPAVRSGCVGQVSQQEDDNSGGSSPRVQPPPIAGPPQYGPGSRFVWDRHQPYYYTAYVSVHCFPFHMSICFSFFLNLFNMDGPQGSMKAVSYIEGVSPGGGGGQVWLWITTINVFSYIYCVVLL